MLGSIFTVNNIKTWYAGLIKPPITPPNWLFAPMWITLYFLMGLVSYISKRNKEKRSTIYP